MRRRPVTTMLMLTIVLPPALPARAQQTPVAPIPRAGSAFCSGGVPTAERRSLPASGQVPTAATAETSTPAKPFTQDQVQGLVRDGLDDESGAKLIEQRGIDFAPAEDFLQSLKAAGASEAFLKALRTAKHPHSGGAKKPLDQVQVITLLAGQIPSHRVAMLVKEHGIGFEPTDEYLQQVRLAGGEDELISALESAKVTKPVTVDPAAQARQAEIRRHVARGAELARKGQYAEAEQEDRAALLLDSQNADLYVSLAGVLYQQKKWDDSASAAREALRLDPKDDLAHDVLVRTHVWKGYWLVHKGEWDGAIAEFREALRFNPKNELAHDGLGLAHEREGRWLVNKGEWDGAIAEFREALLLNPRNDFYHGLLGFALEKKGDLDGAVAEYREVLRLNPNDADAHYSFGVALEKKGDLDGAVAEYREALRSDPKDDLAHLSLGSALEKKGDFDGAVAEYREALRLNPNNALAHHYLGSALESKGDLRGALEEYRAAYMLDPKDALYKQSYERLLQKVNQ